MEGEDVTLRLGDIGRDIQEKVGSLQRLACQFTRENFFCYHVKLSGLLPSGSTSTVATSWSKEALHLIEERSSLPLIVQVSGPATN